MGRGRKIDVDQLDADILNAIRNFGGIPTANALRSSGALRYGINTILNEIMMTESLIKSGKGTLIFETGKVDHN